MPPATFISWNVNGLRAIARKGALAPVLASRPAVICLQETKIPTPDCLAPVLRVTENYNAIWSCAGERAGYSGVAIYSQLAPIEVLTNFPVTGLSPENNLLNREGRMLGFRSPNFLLLNIYFPNGKSGPERLAYKMEFYRQFLLYLNERRAAEEKIIFCGDINTAHQSIDLARPQANEGVSGFLPQERAWIDEVLAAGFVDTFRLFHPQDIQYSWWDMKSRARERNVGWRIDYFFASVDVADQIKDAFIWPQILGSDHCPVGITIDL